MRRKPRYHSRRGQLEALDRDLAALPLVDLVALCEELVTRAHAARREVGLFRYYDTAEGLLVGAACNALRDAGHDLRCALMEHVLAGLSGDRFAMERARELWAALPAPIARFIAGWNGCEVAGWPDPWLHDIEPESYLDCERQTDEAATERAA